MLKTSWYFSYTGNCREYPEKLLIITKDGDDGEKDILVIIPVIAHYIIQNSYIRPYNGLQIGGELIKPEI